MNKNTSTILQCKKQFCQLCQLCSKKLSNEIFFYQAVAAPSTSSQTSFLRLTITLGPLNKKIAINVKFSSSFFYESLFDWTQITIMPKNEFFSLWLWISNILQLLVLLTHYYNNDR